MLKILLTLDKKLHTCTIMLIKVGITFHVRVIFYLAYHGWFCNEKLEMTHLLHTSGALKSANKLKLHIVKLREY